MQNQQLSGKSFYRHVFAIAFPIIIQNSISTFVSLLDNIMVGQIGTTQMSGVAIVNQLLLIFNLCVFGITSGAGIFTAQFQGSNDQQGIRHTFRFKVYCCIILPVLSLFLFVFGSETLIGVFLQGEGSAADAVSIANHASSYLTIMLLGLFPFAISNAYSSTLRECGHTVVPMVSSTVSVFVNLLLNYLLIFGHMGLPVMGVQGAALATVISRYVELGIVAGWTHLHSKKYPFIQGVYRSIRIPLSLLKSMLQKSTPLLLNEAMWSIGMAFLSQCYSTCSLEVVSANNILSTVNNLFNVVGIALATTIGIILGQMLGASRSAEEIQQTNKKLMLLSIGSSIFFGGLLALIANGFPLLYNTTASIRRLSTQLILIAAVFKPFFTYTLACYYTLRSGGKTGITFLYDSGFIWFLSAPLAYGLSRFTNLSILPLFAICQLPDIIKCILGYALIKKGFWIQNLTAKKHPD